MKSPNLAMEKKRIPELKHTFVKLNQGGEIIVLDTGAVIDSEAEAMLQALHSRSTGGLRNHLEILEKKGADNFMANFYVGYGHKSIGDCGTSTIFIEGVSMLAAKAIQDTMLYSGQEASTRYVDFSRQKFLNPTQIEEGNLILERQRGLYLQAQEPTRAHLRKKYPRAENEDEKTYEKAIMARSFDITRSLLPAGASTNLAWHANLRLAADRILFLRHHPLLEVREISQSLEEALKKHHPNSFGHKRYEENEKYQELIAQNYYHHDKNSTATPVVDFERIDFGELEKYRKLFEERPAKTELPKYLGQIGMLDISFQLDFGSFRDLQRHRALVQRMPLLTSDLGFNRWYIDNLPQEIKDIISSNLEKIDRDLERLGISTTDKQYFLPMGYNVANKFSGDLPATIYMVELRDSRFVHPTLQRVAHTIGEEIRKKLDIPIHTDKEPNRFDIKRGQHDISIK